MPHSRVDLRTRHLAQRLRREETVFEVRHWWRLREFKAHGVRFRRQTPIGPYIADFAWLGGRIVIELDGDQHAFRTGHDERRDRWLASQGFKVLRFWNTDVKENIDGVVEAVYRAIEEVKGQP
jgi:very-short-patch-repair endonuclease